MKPPAPTAAQRRRERAERFSEEIARKEAVRQPGFREKNRTLLYGLGMLGIVGWSVAIPTLLGCLNAWYWVQKTGKNLSGNGKAR